jgi:hypothetical protein
MSLARPGGPSLPSLRPHRADRSRVALALLDLPSDTEFGVCAREPGSAVYAAVFMDINPNRARITFAEKSVASTMPRG